MIKYFKNNKPKLKTGSLFLLKIIFFDLSKYFIMEFEILKRFIKQ